NADSQLLLRLTHATRPQADREILLQRTAAGFEGDWPPLPHGPWYVELAPPQRSWFLRARVKDWALPLSIGAPAASR
ncbi:MAG: FixH family protein, partial [Steroidobacteraceae bacterium]|nr:FixH family protein [Steroidobacteraceae bacterium]